MREIDGGRASYKSWLDQAGREGTDFLALVGRAWDLLARELPYPLQREAYNSLICFVTRARNKQESMVCELCSQTSRNYWETLLQRADCVFGKVKPKVNILDEKRRCFEGREFQRYLFRVLEYALIFCNKLVIEDMLRAREQNDIPFNISNDDGLPDSALYRNLEPADDTKTTLELIGDLDLRREARELYDSLRDDWDPAHLNVLCHYLEVFFNLPSQRLSEETQANKDQLHSRVRRRLLDFIAARDYDKEVARVFFTLHATDLCQEIPVSRTYRIDRGETDDPLD